jgi:hypothetical protein
MTIVSPEYFSVLIFPTYLPSFTLRIGFYLVEHGFKDSTNLRMYHSARVGILEENQFILIVNDEGQRETPNYVTFTDNGPVMGRKAMEQADSDPENTIYDFRYAYHFFPGPNLIY